MNLEHLANLAEITGIMLVVVSLAYLNVQVRQNTKMLRSAANQGAAEEIQQMYAPLISDATMTEIFIRGMQDPDSLTPVEHGRFTSFFMSSTFVLQNWYFQTREGLVESNTMNSLCKLLADMSESPGHRQFWTSRRYAFSPEFVEFIEEQVLKQGGDKNYKPFQATPSRNSE